MHSRQKGLFFLISLLFLPYLLLLGDQLSLNISPIRIEQRMERGETLNDIVVVSNNGTVNVRIKVSIADWIMNYEGLPTFVKMDPTLPYSCSAWMRFNPNDFKLPPGQSREIRYSIAVPAQAEEKGYHSAISFQVFPDVPPVQNAKQVVLQPQIMSVLYLTVGKPVLDGELTAIRVEANKAEKEKINFVMSLKNKGKVHFRTQGKVTVKDRQGNEVWQMDIPDEPALPQSERLLRINCEKVFPKGEYTVRAILDIGKKELYGAEAAFTIK